MAVPVGGARLRNFSFELFHPGIERARQPRRLSSGGHAGVAVYHYSNGGLDHPNYGSEALVLFLAWPVGRQGLSKGLSP